MDNFKVDVGKVGKELIEIAEELKHYPHFVEELDDALQELSTYWQGDAWEAFNTQARADIEYLRDVKNFLDRYIETSGQAMDKYSANEEKMINEVSSNLNF